MWQDTLPDRDFFFVLLYEAASYFYPVNYYSYSVNCRVKFNTLIFRDVQRVPVQWSKDDFWLEAQRQMGGIYRVTQIKWPPMEKKIACLLRLLVKIVKNFQFGFV